MDLVLNWDSFSQPENDEIEYDLSETEHDEHEQDNYEDNNGRDHCHNSDNLSGQARTTILGNKDIGDRSLLTLNKDGILILCMTGLGL